MDTKEQIEAILKAVREGRFSKRQIDVLGKGKNVLKLEKGEAVTAQKLDTMYQVVSQASKPEVRANNNKVCYTAEIALESPSILALQKEVAELQARVKYLEGAMLAKASDDNKVCDTSQSISITKVCDGDLCLGFRISLETTITSIERKDGTRKASYVKYYAKKRIGGKLHRIYLGDDVTKERAEEKIKAYCQKHGVTISCAKLG